MNKRYKQTNEKLKYRPAKKPSQQTIQNKKGKVLKGSLKDQIITARVKHIAKVTRHKTAVQFGVTPST